MVIRLLAETCTPLTQKRAKPERGASDRRAKGERGRERERAKPRLAAASKGLHRGPTCQWGIHPSGL